MKRNRRIVVALDLARPDGRRKLEGLMRYLKTRKVRWDLRIKYSPAELQAEHVRRFTDWDIDGVIFSQPTETSGQTPALRELLKLPLPVVLIDPEIENTISCRTKNMSILSTDPDEIGEAAVNLFLSQGVCKSYAFVPDVLDRSWSRRRARSFSDALTAHGETCRHFKPKTFAANDFKELCTWIKALPKPVGILAAYDDRALSVIEACATIGAAIPRDVSILSVGDDALLCENCVPTLSSIRPDEERAGYAAGAMMSALLRASSTVHRTLFPKKTAVPRDSTLPASTGGRLVQKALAYIRAHVRQSLTAEDVAAALHVSRKLLDLRFRELLVTTVTKSIAAERLAHVAELLVKTPMSIGEIADACGFSDAFHLMHLFRRRYGMTTRSYRLSNRHANIRNRI